MDNVIQLRPDRHKLTEAHLERMNVPKRFWSARLSGVHDDDGDDESPQKIIAQYMSKLDDMMSHGVGLILWGNNGRGKTGAAVVVGKEARRRGHTVLFVPAAELKRLVINKVDFDLDQTFYQRALNVDMLIIDDIGKGVQDDKGFGERLLDELIRHRSSNLLSTVMTMNMSPGAFKEQFKKSTSECLKECSLTIEFDGPDLREGRAAQLLASLR